jgi:predicted phosphodiesterase
LHLQSSKAMRIAIIADIHGNLTALDAVLADLRQQKLDVIYHGGDLAFGGGQSHRGD